MSFLSTSLRASLLLLLLTGSGHAARAAGPAPCTPIVAKAAVAAPAAPGQQEPAATPASPPATAPQLTLQLGPLQLRYLAHLDHPTLLDHLLFRSRLAALARQVARGNGPRLPF
ncbi:hypothetical protein GCM10022409_19020 [Hymenobacter glaciei]|uniref:Uncharacterized protein n=1 Tax=Hymenobacter glaciei TaxID=877209 RepID=A0ABP7U2I1_9BACT